MINDHYSMICFQILLILRHGEAVEVDLEVVSCDTVHRYIWKACLGGGFVGYAITSLVPTFAYSEKLQVGMPIVYIRSSCSALVGQHHCKTRESNNVLFRSAGQ